MTSQLKGLAKPFETKLIEKKNNHEYVSHSNVTEAALALVGPYSIERVELIYDAEKVTGALVTICCEIDGRNVWITEAGESENPTSKTNGAKAKDAISDAVKRCWMRLGLGLHLWSGKSYALNKMLDAQSPPEPTQQVARTDTPPVPAKAENTQAETLGTGRGVKMTETLEGMGFAETQIAVLLASEVARDVGYCADLTEAEAKDVMAAARRVKSERDKNKAPKLSNEKAQELHVKLKTGFGVEDTYAYASRILDRVVTTFTDLTTKDVMVVWQAAVDERGTPEQKAEWERQVEEGKKRKAAA